MCRMKKDGVGGRKSWTQDIEDEAVKREIWRKCELFFGHKKRVDGNWKTVYITVCNRFVTILFRTVTFKF